MTLIKKEYRKLIPVTYCKTPDCRLLMIKEKYDLADIAAMIKYPLVKVKKNYRQGLFILTNAVKAFYLIEKHQDEDLSDYFCKYNIEEEWTKNCKFFRYIPYIGIEEFAILHKYDPYVLRNLKMKILGEI